MKINEDLKDAALLKLNSISDERGYLTPVTDDIDPSLLRRTCIVGNFGRGVQRGLHYHRKEWKLYSVVTGAAKFISVKFPVENFDSLDFSGFPVDVAELQFSQQIEKYINKNPSALKTYVISARSPALFVIPAGHANGWVSLEENTNIIFSSNLTYGEAKDDDYRFSPSLIKEDHWKIG